MKMVVYYVIGFEDIVESLIEKGADINTQNFEGKVSNLVWFYVRKYQL